jgi:hypothetical protein
LVTTRRGASSLGCLFTLFIVAVVVYYGINVGEVYWRFYEFQDDMKQEVRFANNTTTAKILSKLRARADSLGLPEEAKDITILRNQKEISIEAEYSELIELPFRVKEVHFRPHAEGTL